MTTHGLGFPFLSDENVLELIAVMIVQLSEHTENHQNIYTLSELYNM